ncbi:MAG: bifunctional riboflavin kinase/FAD synthetase [Lachnospiraceae bacterium]|jgi:riboflavin kinase/FMN adenylyltransferase|nr:bifunctional riboflavin kinase/FAD synthetase [Lachnospiraceae bacterium]
MRIIENTTEFHLENKSAVALGKFDGIHLGHRRLLERVLEQKSQGLWTVVFTFDTSAASFFGGETKELSTREEKRAVFSRLGIDVLIEFPLNRGTAATEPAEFVARYLAEQMQTAYLCAGPDISFGKGGAGDYKLLSEYAGTCGYQVELIDKVRVDGEEVSSTRVRQAVREGDMEKVSVMLGAPYCVSGKVVHGRQLGRKLGMPTANILPDVRKLLPPNGVYYSRARLGDAVYRGISNVGCKPTVSDEKIMGVETYLYDFSGEVYDRDMTVELLAFRRAERTFESVEALRRQIEADVEAGRSFS